MVVQFIEWLEQFPDSGSAIPDDWLNEQGYRMIICKKYVAIYQILHETVSAYHIADTQTEYKKLLSGLSNLKTENRFIDARRVI